MAGSARLLPTRRFAASAPGAPAPALQSKGLTDHATIETRSRALHAAVAGQLRRDPARLEEARERVAGWLRDGAVAPAYARAWQEALSGPLEDLLDLLVDPGERAAALRQVSPFAGWLEPRERWRILREHGLRC